MIEDAVDAFAQIFTPPFRATLLKSLGLTIALLVVIWLGLDRLAGAFIQVQTSWLATILSWIVGLGLVVGLAFLIAPVTSLVAGFFLDDISAIVERAIDPTGTPGPADPRRRRDDFRLALRRPVDPRQSDRAGAAVRAGRQYRRLPRRQWLSARARIFRTRRDALSLARPRRGRCGAISSCASFWPG